MAVREPVTTEGELRDCIEAFRDTVRAHAGDWWAPTSALPCPKNTLLRALIAARDASYRVDMTTYKELRTLIGELTLFVADEDLERMRPFFGQRGRITGRPLGDPALERARADADAIHERLMAERVALLPGLAGTDGGLHQPIGAQREALHVSRRPSLAERPWF